MKRKIGDKEFEEAYENENNKRILNYVGNMFSSIQKDDLESLKLESLWRALESYIPSEGSKFTSFLFQRMRWSCLSYLNQNYKHMSVCSLAGDIQDKRDDYIEQIDIQDALNNDEDNLFSQRFIEKRTYREIALANGYSHETARNRVGRLLSKIRSMYDTRASTK